MTHLTTTHTKLEALLQNDPSTLRDMFHDAQKRAAEIMQVKFPLGTESLGWEKIEKAKAQILEDVKKEFNVDLHDEEHQELQRQHDRDDISDEGFPHQRKMNLIYDMCHLSWSYGCDWRYERLYKANRKSFKWSQFFTKKDGKYYSKAPMFGLESGQLVAEKVAGGWWNVTRLGTHFSSPDSLVDIVRDYEVDLERAKSIAKDDIKTQIERIGEGEIDAERGLSDAEILELRNEVLAEGVMQQLFSFKDDSYRPEQVESDVEDYLIPPTTYEVARQRLKMHTISKTLFSRQSYFQKELNKMTEQARKIEADLKASIEELQEFTQTKAETIERIEAGEIIYS